MREAQFLKQNTDKWKLYEQEIKTRINTGKLADRFIEITDDFSYSKTFYPKSNTTKYLNGLAGLFHQNIYKNKKEKPARLWSFWQYELPYLFKYYHRQFAWSLIFFTVFCCIGAISARYDENFIRLILGDGYVNMTDQNIKNGNPFGVYKSGNQFTMFWQIAFNNIKVSIITYAMGALFSVGTVLLLFQNGLMLGSFEYYFFSKSLGLKSISVIFIHGTLEISALVIAGASGLILGNSILFPGTYSRSISILRGGRDGLKVVIGLVPVFLTAAFLESFVTRYDHMPLWLSLCILGGSLTFIIWYFIVYPNQLHKQIETAVHNASDTSNQHFIQWLNKKLNSEK